MDAFLLPRCSKRFPQDIGKGRPCLNAHIGKCMAVCSGKIRCETYNEAVKGAVHLIRYGKKDASDEEVRAAAKTVHADEFIEQLENGYDTEVGEGGARLSTGQKQLISFARVILADPRIFVLDEATSSIDTETEVLIQSAIRTVLKNRTSFIVAHRLSTIQSADIILVMKDGNVIEQGNHEELLAKGGFYSRLYNSQFS